MEWLDASALGLAPGCGAIPFGPGLYEDALHTVRFGAFVSGWLGGVVLRQTLAPTELHLCVRGGPSLFLPSREREDDWRVIPPSRDSIVLVNSRHRVEAHPEVSRVLRAYPADCWIDLRVRFLDGRVPPRDSTFAAFVVVPDPTSRERHSPAR